MHEEGDIFVQEFVIGVLGEFEGWGYPLKQLLFEVQNGSLSLTLLKPKHLLLNRKDFPFPRTPLSLLLLVEVHLYADVGILNQWLNLIKHGVVFRMLNIAQL